jgi:S-adenosylmethionine hydrolase
MPSLTVSLLTDVGSATELPGVLASIVREFAPDATVVHLTHDIDPYDVRGGSLALARSVAYVASGVVVAAVDPLTDRPMVAVEVAGGKGVLFGPDNGLLAPAVAMAGGAERAVVLDNPEFHLDSAGAILAVRDVLVPAAAAWCSGTAFNDLGSSISVDALLPGVIPISRLENDELHCEALWVDRYGNIQLNAAAADLAAFGDLVRLRIGADVRTAVRRSSLIGLGEGQLAVVADPYGLVMIGLCRQAASQELGVGSGDAVVIGSAESVGTPVQLRR